MTPLAYKGAGANGVCPVTFDEVTHTYKLRGKWLPGMTRVLADCGYSDFSHVNRDTLREARQRGKAVHWGCQLIDEYCPDATTLDEVLEVIELDERLHPYFAQYIAVKLDQDVVVVHNEVLVYSASWMVCGHLDKIVRYRRNGRTAIWDLKTWREPGPTPDRSAVLQVAGYRAAARECLGIEVDAAMPIALPGGEGTYRVYYSAQAVDESVMHANCISWWDRKSCGKIRGGDESEVELAA